MESCYSVGEIFFGDTPNTVLVVTGTRSLLNKPCTSLHIILGIGWDMSARGVKILHLLQQP
eukprot:CCRYP_009554-RA/>CCRYP_009554-RA protein AED:0.74 eAED:0.48 QI:0/0/0/0.5/0/0/2/0/60